MSLELQPRFQLVGYQLQIEPRAPFTLGRAPAGPRSHPDALVLSHLRPGGPDSVTVIPGETTAAGDGGTHVVLGEGMNDATPVGRFLPAAPTRKWQVTTPAYRVDLPQGYVVKSTVPAAPWPFEYHGIEERDGGMIVMRGPLRGARVPPPPALVAAGQEQVDEDLACQTPWVEVEYQRQGVTWRQRHLYAVLAQETVVLVSAQAPVQTAATIMADALRVASSVELIEPAPAG
jgi:hypothetical protein